MFLNIYTNPFYILYILMLEIDLQINYQVYGLTRDFFVTFGRAGPNN